MIKILTAIGNPKLNYELRKYDEFNIVSKDIQYLDGIIELLELNSDINYLIISESLEGNISLEEIINSIYEINRQIKIIIILEKSNKEKENILLKKGIYDIFYDDSNLNEIINTLKTKNIEYLNKELRAEIEELKKIINLKNKEKKSKYFNFDKKKIKNEECNIFAITGNRGIGKTTLLFFLANLICKKNRVLLIDFNLSKENFSCLLDKNKSDYFIEYRKNIDVIYGLNLLYNSNKFKIEALIEKINKIKNQYNYIFIDINIEENEKENKEIFNICNKVIFITGTGKIEINKTQKNISNILKNNQNIYNKINLIFNRCNLIEFIFYRKIKSKKNNYIKIFKIKNIISINFYLNYLFNKNIMPILLKNKIKFILNKICCK